MSAEVQPLRTTLKAKADSFRAIYRNVVEEFDSPVWTKEDGDYFINMGIYLQIRYDRLPEYFYALTDELLDYDSGVAKSLHKTKLATLDQLKTVCVYMMIQEEELFRAEIGSVSP